MTDYARKHTNSVSSVSEYSNSGDLEDEATKAQMHGAEGLNSPLLGPKPSTGKRASFAENANTTTYIPKRPMDESFGGLGYGNPSETPEHKHHDDGLAEFLPPPPESLDFDMWESRVNLVYNIELLKRGHLNSILKVGNLGLY